MISESLSRCAGRFGARGERTGGRLRRAILALAVALLLPAGTESALAARESAGIELSASQRADLTRIETYLNGVRTVRGRFLQASSTGEVAEGTVYISRPGRMRIEYQPPVPMLIVADGTFLIYHDLQLNQVSYLPLGSTPAGILLEKRIALTGKDLTVTGFEREANALRVTVARSESPAEGRLTLVFSDQPLALTKWIVVDAQGVATTVSLTSAEFNVPLDDGLFRFRNPKFFENGDFPR